MTRQQVPTIVNNSQQFSTVFNSRQQSSTVVNKFQQSSTKFQQRTAKQFSSKISDGNQKSSDFKIVIIILSTNGRCAHANHTTIKFHTQRACKTHSFSRVYAHFSGPSRVEYQGRQEFLLNPTISGFSFILARLVTHVHVLL